MLAVVAIGSAKYLLHIPFRFAKTFKDFVLGIKSKKRY